MYFKLLLGLFALALPTVAVAQTKPGSKPATPAPASTQVKPVASAQDEPKQASEATIATRADALTANIAQALNLAPAQVEKVRAINLASVRNVETARQRYMQQPSKLQSYIQEVGMARLEQLKDVLTAAQFAKYQQKREQKMGIPSVGGSTRGTPPPGLGGRNDNQ